MSIEKLECDNGLLVGGVPTIKDTVNGLVDIRSTNIPTKFKDKLFIFCGDSTTEQAVANQGMFERLINFYSSNGMVFEGAEVDIKKTQRDL